MHELIALLNVAPSSIGVVEWGGLWCALYIEHQRQNILEGKQEVFLNRWRKPHDVGPGVAEHPQVNCS